MVFGIGDLFLELIDLFFFFCDGWNGFIFLRYA